MKMLLGLAHEYMPVIGQGQNVRVKFIDSLDGFFLKDNKVSLLLFLPQSNDVDDIPRPEAGVLYFRIIALQIIGSCVISTKQYDSLYFCIVLHVSVVLLRQ
jgi:hypothetical protein